MDDLAADDSTDPHDAIVRLEARIEVLAAKLENCRKLRLAARIAIAAGAALLAATLIRAIAFDPATLLGAIAALLGGLVLLGSNRTTARQAAEERAKAEAARAALIESLGLRVVRGQETLH